MAELDGISNTEQIIELLVQLAVQDELNGKPYQSPDSTGHALFFRMQKGGFRFPKDRHGVTGHLRKIYASARFLLKNYDALKTEIPFVALTLADRRHHQAKPKYELAKALVEKNAKEAVERVKAKRREKRRAKEERRRLRKENDCSSLQSRQRPSG